MTLEHKYGDVQNKKQKGVDNCSAEIHLSHIGGQESVHKVSKHNHEPRYTLEQIYFMKELKHEAIKDRYSKASEVVDRLLAKKNIFSDRYKNLTTTGCLTYTALTGIVNRIRRKLCPPKEFKLLFKIDFKYIPDGFFQRDIVFGEDRFLFFSTYEQLRHLYNARIVKKLDSCNFWSFMLLLVHP